MGKKVKVTTKCGEVHTYEYDQEVETVEIIEREKYELQDRFNEIMANYDKGCGGVSCGDCAFQIVEPDKCAFVKTRYAMVDAQGYDK